MESLSRLSAQTVLRWPLTDPTPPDQLSRIDGLVTTRDVFDWLILQDVWRGDATHAAWTAPRLLVARADFKAGRLHDGHIEPPAPTRRGRGRGSDVRDFALLCAALAALVFGLPLVFGG